MRSDRMGSQWSGTALVAVVYIYFLIFAQFAFLDRLAALGIAANSLKLVMAAMAAGGILLSLLTPRLQIIPDASRRLRIGLACCGAAALLTLAPLNVAAASALAFLIGAALGVTTVTLVTHLRTWIGDDSRAMIKVGLGTGAAYLVCNIPAVFTAAPSTQALLAGGLCLLATLLPMAPVANEQSTESSNSLTLPFVVVLASLSALVWLDSAAFYIIQHNAALKAGTWMGNAHLWMNAALHFSGAILSGVLLQRSRTQPVLAIAYLALAFACILLHHSPLILSASLFYPIGVSLYSVALVAYPSLIAQGSTSARGRQAGWLYAIAGWVGSALGIGMAKNLGHVPLLFVVIAGIVVLTPICFSLFTIRPKEAVVVGAALLIAALAYRLLPDAKINAAQSSIERGRRVYISEGCISCHSQYVRPDSPDVLMWGPTKSIAQIRAQRPPLIGNRRQGPDLAEVGMRRSPWWLKAHLMQPAELSYHSPMPSFAFLFQDGRGDDLVNYLSSLTETDEQPRRVQEDAWKLADEAVSDATLQEGATIFTDHCATCHELNGVTRKRWQRQWPRQPEDPSHLWTYAASRSTAYLARIAKFGIAHTEMPGHEYLNDRQIASVALWLKHGSK